MSRAELIALVGAQARRISGQDAQIADSLEQNAQLAAWLAQVAYLLSRNSGQLFDTSSRDDDPGLHAAGAQEVLRWRFGT